MVRSLASNEQTLRNTTKRRRCVFCLRDNAPIWRAGDHTSVWTAPRAKEKGVVMIAVWFPVQGSTDVKRRSCHQFVGVRRSIEYVTNHRSSSCTGWWIAWMVHRKAKCYRWIARKFNILPISSVRVVPGVQSSPLSFSPVIRALNIRIIIRSILIKYKK